MKHKYTLAKWLAVHTVALTVVLVLTILFPLESCWKNYNYNILPVDKKQKTTGSTLSGQKQTQDIDSETEDPHAASNLMPTDIIEGVPAQVKQIDQPSQGTSLPSSGEGTSHLALSGASNPVINKETQISKQQLLPNSNSKIQVKTLQAEQMSPDRQKQVKGRLLEENEKVEEIKDSEVKETKVKEGDIKDKVNKPKITKGRRRRCRKRGVRK